MKERAPGQHVRSLEQPLIEPTILLPRRVQLLPDIYAPARGAQTRESQFGTVRGGQCFELIKLLHAMTSHDDRNLERAEVRRGQIVHGAPRRVVTADATNSITRESVRAIDGNLHVEIVEARESTSGALIDSRPVRRKLNPDTLIDGVLNEVEEVASNHRFTPADVDVKDLHGGDLVDESLRLGGGQLSRITPSRGGETVCAGQVARVREFPGQTDRCGESSLEAVAQ